MEGCIVFLGKASVFSIIDVNSSYWQVEVEEANQDKTAFTSYHGLYRFVRIPVGLKNE